ASWPPPAPPPPPPRSPRPCAARDQPWRCPSPAGKGKDGASPLWPRPLPQPLPRTPASGEGEGEGCVAMGVVAVEPSPGWRQVAGGGATSDAGETNPAREAGARNAIRIVIAIRDESGSGPGGGPSA